MAVRRNSSSSAVQAVGALDFKPSKYALFFIDRRVRVLADFLLNSDTLSAQSAYCRWTFVSKESSSWVHGCCSVFPSFVAGASEPRTGAGCFLFPFLSGTRMWALFFNGRFRPLQCRVYPQSGQSTRSSLVMLANVGQQLDFFFTRVHLALGLVRSLRLAFPGIDSCVQFVPRRSFKCVCIDAQLEPFNTKGQPGLCCPFFFLAWLGFYVGTGTCCQTPLQRSVLKGYENETSPNSTPCIRNYFARIRPSGHSTSVALA